MGWVGITRSPLIHMPINQKLMAKLQKQYGKEEGKRIYYAMEQKGDPATKDSAIAKAMKDTSSKR